MSASSVEARVALAQAGDRGRVHAAAQSASGAWTARCGRQVRGADIRVHPLAAVPSLPLCPACADLAAGLASSLEAGLAALLGDPSAPVAVRMLAVPVAAVVVPDSHVRVPDAGLAESVAEHGVLAPILVARSGAGYLLLAGGRRLAAARAAGLPSIPALVREPAPLVALVENLHRRDLDPIEEARAFAAALEDGGSVAALARSLGMSRPVVANALRLLDLPAPVQAHLRSGALTAAHGLALLTAPAEARAALAEEAVAADLPVAAVRARAAAPAAAPLPDVADLLAALLAVRVRASHRADSTRLVLDVPDADLPRVLAALGAR